MMTTESRAPRMVRTDPTRSHAAKALARERRAARALKYGGAR